MEEINNVIDAEFEEVIEEPAEKNWKKHLTKQNLKKVGIAVAAMAATVLYVATPFQTSRTTHGKMVSTEDFWKALRTSTNPTMETLSTKKPTKKPTSNNSDLNPHGFRFFLFEKDMV